MRVFMSALMHQARRGAGVQVCDCERDWLWVRSPFEEIKYLLKFIFLFIRNGVGRELRQLTKCFEKFGGKWKTECLNTPSIYTAVYGTQLEAGLLMYY